MKRKSKKRRNPILLKDHPHRKALCRLLARLSHPLTARSGVYDLILAGHSEVRVFCHEAQLMGLISGYDENKVHCRPVLTEEGRKQMAEACGELDEKPKANRKSKRLLRKKKSKKSRSRRRRRHSRARRG